MAIRKLLRVIATNNEYALNQLAEMYCFKDRLNIFQECVLSDITKLEYIMAPNVRSFRTKVYDTSDADQTMLHIKGTYNVSQLIFNAELLRYKVETVERKIFIVEDELWIQLQRYNKQWIIPKIV